MGNLYVSDSAGAAAYMITRTGTTLDFGDWALSTPSGVLSAQVEDEGNQPLTLGTPYFTASGDTGDFSVSGGDCAAGGTVAAGTSCELDATFTPSASGSRTDTLTLSSNAAAAQVTLTGDGAATAATTTTLSITSPACGAPSFGQAITLSVTVTAASGTPTGTVTLLVDGAQFGDATLNSSGTTTFNLASGLTGGSHTLVAIYNGTAAFNGSVSSALALSVGQAVTTSALSIVPPFTDPLTAINHILVPVPNATPQTYTWVPESVTLTVVLQFAGTGIPTGTVNFGTGSTSLGTANLVPGPGGTFQASITVGVDGPACAVSDSVPTCPTPPTYASQLPLGADTITATYSGDPNYLTSTTSGTVIVVDTPYVTVSQSGTSITSSTKNNGSVTFNFTTYGGWSGLVGFSCLASSLPANARCVFSPGQVEVVPSTPTAAASNPPVNLTVTIDQPPQTPTASKFVWWLAAPTGLLLLFTRRRWMRRGWAAVATIFALALLGSSLTGLIACTSGLANVTPAGTSTITVVASSDPFNPGSTTTMQSCPANNPASAPCSQTTFSVSLTVQ